MGVMRCHSLWPPAAQDSASVSAQASTRATQSTIEQPEFAARLPRTCRAAVILTKPPSDSNNMQLDGGVFCRRQHAADEDIAHHTRELLPLAREFVNASGPEVVDEGFLRVVAAAGVAGTRSAQIWDTTGTFGALSRSLSITIIGSGIIEGIENELIAGAPATGAAGRVHRRARLGGPLNYHEHAA